MLQFEQLDFPIVKLYENFNTLPLFTLYKQQILILWSNLWMIVSSFNDCFLSKNLTSDHNTTMCPHLHISSIFTSFGHRPIKFQGCLLRNQLPSYCQNIQSAHCFQTKIRVLLSTAVVCYKLESILNNNYIYNLKHILIIILLFCVSPTPQFLFVIYRQHWRPEMVLIWLGLFCICFVFYFW